MIMKADLFFKSKSEESHKDAHSVRLQFPREIQVTKEFMAQSLLSVGRNIMI